MKHEFGSAFTPGLERDLADVSPHLNREFKCLVFSEDRREGPFTDTMLRVRNALKALCGDAGLPAYQEWVSRDPELFKSVGGDDGVARSWKRSSGPEYSVADAAAEISKLANTTRKTIEFMIDGPAKDEALREAEFLYENFKALGEKPDDPLPPLPESLLEYAADVTTEGMADREANAIVQHLIYPRDQGMIYGESGTGKSFIAQDLLWHVALGKDWHGRRVKQAPVLYVVLEGVDGFRKRMLAYKRRLGDPGHWFARLRVPVSLDASKAGENGVRMIAEAAKELARCAGQPVGMIVIDTLARAISGKDENAADAIMSYLEKRVGIITKATDAAVITIHHENKMGGVRGSSALYAGLDFVLHATGGQLINEKTKDDGTGALFAYELEQVEIATATDGQPITSCVLRTRPVAKRNPKKPAAPMTKAQKALAGAVAEIGSAGDWQPGTVPGTGEPGSYCPVDRIRDAFMQRYPVGDVTPERSAGTRRQAWLAASRNLPPGYSIETDATGKNVFWVVDDPFSGVLQ